MAVFFISYSINIEYKVEMARFSVVEFEDGLHLVPCTWLIDNSECFWPPYKNNKLIHKAVFECEEVDPEKWETIKVVRIFAMASK